MLIVVNDVETVIADAEARRLCKRLRGGTKRAVEPTAAALVLAEAISRGRRDVRMSRLVIREPGAIRALTAALEARSKSLSGAEARLLDAARGQLTDGSNPR